MMQIKGSPELEISKFYTYPYMDINTLTTINLNSN